MNRNEIGDIFDIFDIFDQVEKVDRVGTEVKPKSKGNTRDNGLYIYVALSKPRKIDALPCGYPPRPSR